MQSIHCDPDKTADRLESPRTRPPPDDREHCPICNRLNRLDSPDTCEHFMGIACRGDVVLSQHFERFAESYHAFVCVRRCLCPDTQAPGPFEAQLALLAVSLGVSPNLVYLADDSQHSAKDAWLELLDFECGREVAVRGRRGPRGCTLYHADPAEAEALAQGYRRLTAEALTAFLDPPPTPERAPGVRAAAAEADAS